MFFLASIPDDKLKDLILKVRAHNSQSDQAFHEIETEFIPLLKKNVGEIMSRYRHRGISYKDFPQLFNSAKIILWNVLVKDFEIPKDDIFQQLFHQLNRTLPNKMIDEAQSEINDTVNPQMSHVTKGNVLKTHNFMEQYKAEHHKYPDMQAISKGTGFSPKQVASYIQAFSLFNIHHVDQNTESTALDKFMVSNSPLPDEQYLEKEEKEVWYKAIARNIPKLEQEIGRSSSEGADIIKKNFKNIITSLIDSGGKNIPRISAFYGISGGAGEKTLSRLWHNFVNIMKHDQELKKYVLATRSMFIQKVASEILSNNLYFESQLIKKVANL